MLPFLYDRVQIQMEGIMNTGIRHYILLLWRTKFKFANYYWKMESKLIVQIVSNEQHLKWLHLWVSYTFHVNKYIAS